MRKAMSAVDALDQLPEPVLEIADDAIGDTLRRIELRRSILAIAGLDHAAETALVNAVAKNRRTQGKGRRHG
jgi:hypothetical protein